MSRETMRAFDDRELPRKTDQSDETGFRDVKDRVFDMASNAKDKAGQVAHSVASGVQSTASYLWKHDFKQMGKDATNICRRYPTQSVIAALAVGFLLGRSARQWKRVSTLD